jgi:hypothetical protein
MENRETLNGNLKRQHKLHRNIYVPEFPFSMDNNNRWRICELNMRLKIVRTLLKPVRNAWEPCSYIKDTFFI